MTLSNFETVNVTLIRGPILHPSDLEHCDGERNNRFTGANLSAMSQSSSLSPLGWVLFEVRNLLYACRISVLFRTLFTHTHKYTKRVHCITHLGNTDTDDLPLTIHSIKELVSKISQSELGWAKCNKDIKANTGRTDLVLIYFRGHEKWLYKDLMLLILAAACLEMAK